MNPDKQFDGLSLAIAEAGEGRPALILHGGGGPGTVAMIADYVAEEMHALTPVHPGWNGTERPAGIESIADLARLYLEELARRQLDDVLLIGSSIGGWIAAQMAVNDEAGRITGMILIDAVGVKIEGEPITDLFALDARGVAERRFHDPKRFYVDPARVSAEQAAIEEGDTAAMRVLAGDPYMHDPALLGKLGRVRFPVLVIWGDSDAIATPAYGRRFAAAFPDSRFELIEEAGHSPQIEQPEALFAQIDGYTG